MTEYIINKMRDYLTAEQLELLKRTIVEYELASNIRSNSDYLSDFINSKRFNGCSEKTIKVYRRDAVLYCEWYKDAVIHSTKKDIEALLGHSSINTTLIYCEVNEKKLKRDHAKYVI